MNEYITFHKILDLIESFQQQSPILNSFGYGNLVDFSRTISGNTVQYPYLFVVPQSILYDENTTTYQLSLLFADILNTDLTNEKDCVSDMSLQARRFISYVKRGIDTFPELYDNLDIQMPVSALPYMERMGDHVAGVALDVNLIVFEDINACDYYNPTPTITPTNTPTPTITPTMTLTPTPTDPTLCANYVLNSNFITQYSFITCNGIPSGTTLNAQFNVPVCAKEGSMSIVSGTGTFNQSGYCS